MPARAQTVVDMSLISCDQFLKSPQERKDILSSWMGGYFSSMKNQATIDSRYVARNSQKVAKYCSKARNETLTERNSTNLALTLPVKAAQEETAATGNRERPLEGLLVPPFYCRGRQVP
jgi:acid stress chaperone HdeB